MFPQMARGLSRLLEVVLRLAVPVNVCVFGCVCTCMPMCSSKDGRETHLSKFQNSRSYYEKNRILGSGVLQVLTAASR